MIASRGPWGPTNLSSRRTLARDVITDFQASGLQHDVLQFRHDTFADFATVLAHATQVEPDVVITADAMSSVTLQGIHISSLQKYDFHFV